MSAVSSSSSCGTPPHLRAERLLHAEAVAAGQPLSPTQPLSSSMLSPKRSAGIRREDADSAAGAQQEAAIDDVPATADTLAPRPASDSSSSNTSGQQPPLPLPSQSQPAAAQTPLVHTPTAAAAGTTLSPVRQAQQGHARRLTVTGLTSSLGSPPLSAQTGSAATTPAAGANTKRGQPITINRRRASMSATVGTGSLLADASLASEISPAGVQAHAAVSAESQAAAHKLKTQLLLNSALQRESNERGQRIAELEAEAKTAAAERQRLAALVASAAARIEAAEARTQAANAKAAEAQQDVVLMTAKLQRAEEASAMLVRDRDASVDRALHQAQLVSSAQSTALGDLDAQLAARTQELRSAEAREATQAARFAALDRAHAELQQSMMLLREDLRENAHLRKSEQEEAYALLQRSIAAEEAQLTLQSSLNKERESADSLRCQLAYQRGISRIHQRDLSRLQGLFRRMMIRHWVHTHRRKKVLFDSLKKLYRMAADFSNEVYRGIDQRAAAVGGSGSTSSAVVVTHVAGEEQNGLERSSGGRHMDPLSDLAPESALIGLHPHPGSHPLTSASGVSLLHQPIRNDKKHLSRMHTPLGDLLQFLADLCPRLEIVAADAVKEQAYWRRMAEAFFQRSIGLKSDVLDLQLQKVILKEEALKARSLSNEQPGGAGGTGGPNGNGQADDASSAGAQTGAAAPRYLKSTANSRRASLSSLQMLSLQNNAALSSTGASTASGSGSSASATPPMPVRTLAEKRASNPLGGASTSAGSPALQPLPLASSGSQPPSPDMRVRSLSALAHRRSDSRSASPAPVAALVPSSSLNSSPGPNPLRQSSPATLPLGRRPDLPTARGSPPMPLPTSLSGDVLVSDIFSQRRNSSHLLPTLDARPGGGAAGAMAGAALLAALPLHQRHGSFTVDAPAATGETHASAAAASTATGASPALTASAAPGASLSPELAGVGSRRPSLSVLTAV